MSRMQLLTAAHWLACAEEARALAQQLADAGARQTMLGIAEGYERLARHAAAWAPAEVVPDQAEDG